MTDNNNNSAGLLAGANPPSPLPQQPQLFHTEPIDVTEPWQQELVDCYSRLMAMISGRPQLQVHDMLQQKASESMQYHCELVNGLVYAIMTNAETSAVHFQYLNIVSRDRFAHALSRLQLIASAPKFPRIRAEVRTQLLWIMEEMVKMNMPGVEQVAMTLTRQLRGGDVSAANLRLCRQMLDFLQNNYEWLTRQPMLVALVAYAYGRLILDHNSRISEQQQRERESAFVVRLLRDRFIECAVIGRDLVRMLQDVAKISVFRDLWHDLLYNPHAVSAHFSGIEQLLRTPTPRIFLANRLTFEMESRLLYILEHLPVTAYSRNLMWFVHRYLSTPESESIYSDIIRYIVGVFHPSNMVLASNIVPRYVFLGILLRFIRSQVVASNAKLALFYDWLFYDPKADNIMNIEPGVLIIARSIDKYAYLTASFLEFLVYLSDAYMPSMAADIRSSIAQVMQDAVEKGVIPSLLPVFEHPRVDATAKRYMHQLFPRLVPPVPSSMGAIEPKSKDDDSPLLLPPPQHDFGNTQEEAGDMDPVAKMFDDDDGSDGEAGPPLSSIVEAVSVEPLAEQQPEIDIAIDEELPLLVDIGDVHQIESTQEALDDPSLWIFGSTLRDFAATIDEQPAVSEDQIKEITSMYAQSEASSQSVAHILSAALVDAELEDIETPGAAKDHDILYYIFETARPFFADMSSSTAEPPRRRIVELLVRLTQTRVDVGFRWLLYSIAELGSGSAPYRQYVSAYAQGTVRLALARDMGALQERFPEHFYAVLPTVYSALPDEFIGSRAIIKSVVALIDQPQVYRLCMLIARGKLRLFGGDKGSKLEALTSTIGSAMDGDDAFEQVCLWQLLEAELAGNSSAIVHVSRYILLEHRLDPTSNSEAANGLLSLLRSNPPTPDILTVLVKYTSAKGSAEERVDFCGSILVAWSSMFKQQLMTCVSAANKSVEEHEIDLLVTRFEGQFSSDKHTVAHEIKSQYLLSIMQSKLPAVISNGSPPRVTKNNGSHRKTRNEGKKTNNDDNTSSSEDNTRKKIKRKKRGHQRGRRQRRNVVIASEDEESESDVPVEPSESESAHSSPVMYSSSLSSMSSDDND
ncbi:hypothetical protein IW140_005246 [Coemansia sp. RSA 1813]|nr:hypothetical protein EV178_005624 [Coemansia sp. RSA 1646]KAJ1768429.1 hypothetical protein LPJ74_004883 [Coemansia sp. RSA 1843]KAJ2090143.1 hypothetical protein IW138_002953 [Coemansia sp. RSA 986]KAJ2214220.1 hypothetical protein EV179_003240 [Coemansia sp. RSA 487]KAJ2565661.1 hypothetical protein IW140_005246 [Coemansia sp. RSA 1813]